MSRPRVHTFFEIGPTPMLISHAGDTASGAVSGSFTAYRRARGLGFHAFQVDVVPAAGGELLSMHAVLGRKRALERGDLADARRWAGDDVPTLGELLAWFPEARWNIELKSARCEQALIDVIAAHPRRDLLAVSAPFHTRTLRRLRARFPDLATNASLLEGALVGLNLLPWRRHGGDAVQLFHLLAVGPIIRRNVRRNRPVHVWTVNDAARALQMVSRGVSGFVTDDYVGITRATSPSDRDA